ncbi:hypothetical protein BJY01DRAFT_229022 [Aspergillus pseudoustus]|uniref:BTB domain-containing protein n=1 Tax=Aspergillus pseudoustus TaxID=1810923 RepID=A0ABR4IIR2_9EURO
MAKSLGKLTLSAGIARLNVGADQTPFDVHVELLCDKSPFFNNLYSDRTDSTIPEVPISLPDVDPDVFAEIISWMYRSQLNDELTYQGRINFLLELWVLAEKFEIPALQNQAITFCKARTENSPSTALPNMQAIEYVYTKTKPVSPLRRFLVDVWIWRATAVKFAKRKEELPRAFVEDLCEALLHKHTDTSTTTGLTGTTPAARPFPSPPGLEQYFVECAPSVPSPGPAAPAAPESPPSRSAARNTDTNDSPRLATPEQMANRKMKSPSPRLAPRKLSGFPEAQDGFAVLTASTSTSDTVLPSSDAHGKL